MKDALQRIALNILDASRDMSLATIRPDGFPQATVVSFVNDGLEIFFGVGASSQKSKNLARDDRISATITPPYETWDEITGLSLAGHVQEMSTATEMDMVGKLMREKFPEMNTVDLSEMDDLKVFRIQPFILSVLDYSKGFGHVDTFRLDASDIANTLESMRHRWLMPA